MTLTPSLRAPLDDFAAVYAERLWSLVPATYREADAVTENPGSLRAVVEVAADQAAGLRRSIDRLGEDPFVEVCDPWALPYLADLVGTRLVSALNERGRRVDVAKTIYYRRRKGTPRVLEELVADITGWEGTVVEMFRRLARARHGLDPDFGPRAGRFTATLPGGWADLRSVRGGEQAGRAFDEYCFTPDVRRADGERGRHAIAKLGLHLYRVPAWRLDHVVPSPGINAVTRTIDPSERSLQLFMRRSRPDDWDEWRRPLPWEVPAPMPCRLLGLEVYAVTEALIAALDAGPGLTNAQTADLRTLVGHRLDGRGALRRALQGLPTGAALLAPGIFSPLVAGALVADCGHAALLPASLRIESTPGTTIEPTRILAGTLPDPNWTTLAADARVVVDAELGRLRFLGGAPANQLRVSYHFGWPGPLGAGPWPRSGGLADESFLVSGGGSLGAGTVAPDDVTQIEDSLSYTTSAPVAPVTAAVLQAADGERPYVRVTGGDWVFDSGANVESTLVIDGVWVGADAGRAVRLRGDFERVVFRTTTFDPGGETTTGAPIAAVPIVVEGAVERLELDQAVTGPIRLGGAGSVTELVLTDSVVHAHPQAIDLPLAEAVVTRSTVLGRVDVDHLRSDDSLFAGIVNVTDNQQGCFRFSSALADAHTRLPHPYESFLLDAALLPSLFTSAIFGYHAYLQLSGAAPIEIFRGAENGSEMGVWSSLLDPIRRDGLRAKVEEFAPFGLIPFYVFET